MKLSRSCLAVLVLGSQMLFGENPQTSVSQNNRYPQFCYRAAHDDLMFQTFRRQQQYREIVETVCYEGGQLLVLELSKHYSHLFPYFKKICFEDTIGGPLKYTYPEIGSISPAVLRYVKVLGDLQREFGDLSKFHIAEIGGGFGGQCKIIHDIGGFAKYDIIDIPEVAPLIKKYLACFLIDNVTIASFDTLRAPMACDLVISNFAFSEINRAGQLFYIETIINQAPRGYMLYNDFPRVNPLSLEEFVGLLKKSKKNVRVLHEDPRIIGTIVIWG